MRCTPKSHAGRGKEGTDMSNNTGANTHVVGTLRSVDGAGVVRMEDGYDTDIDDLWSALADPQRLARWIADVEGDLRVGGQFHASSPAAGPAPAKWRCANLRGDSGDHGARAERPDRHRGRVRGRGEQTCLVVEERGLPSTARRARGRVASTRRGLAAHLAGRERVDWRARSTQLTPAYRERTEDLGDHQVGRQA